MLEFKDVSKVFLSEKGEHSIFKDFNFKAEKGDFISIIGSNGAGKSTLLNMLNGNVIPDSGHIYLENKDITKVENYKRAKWISQVFQNPTMGTAPEMTVLENLSMAKNKGKKFNLQFGLDIRSMGFYKEILSTLNLGLEDQLFTKVGRLSGGQRQCLSLLMSTLNKPEILLLDEHTAALDPKTSVTIMNKTTEIVEKSDMTTFMITHNMEDAIQYGDRLIMLHKGEVIFDIKGKKKYELTVEQLLEMFSKKEQDIKLEVDF